ncbi:MAG: sensor histidine kinase [Ferruginibacter sp.]
MQNASAKGIIIFIILCTLIILILITFITVIIYRYQKKQHAYFKELEELKVVHQNNLLQSQLEIQEQTFQNISREIHDSIGQKLTLAKLNLNTLNPDQLNGQINKVNTAITMIGEAINDLSDISRSMSSELIMQNGLIKALEFEVAQLTKLALYNIKLIVTGNSVFLDAHTELVLFRIVQEALNNIVKHSSASLINISIHFDDAFLILKVKDNGTGFSNDRATENGIGLKNMSKRAMMLNGEFSIDSNSKNGTTITIKIPIHEYKAAV